MKNLTPDAVVAGPVPRVSVVIPVYNYGRFLEQCVRSALTQTGVDVDVVVVDDCSTDDTRDVARRLAEADPRVQLVVQERNGGHIANFNRALGLATGDYVVKLDADDCLPPGSLARSAALLTSYADVSFVYGRPQVFSSDEPPAIDEDPDGLRTTWTVWPGEDWLWRRLRHGHNPIMQPEVMIRRSALDEVGGHRPELPASSDLNLWLRLASVGDVGHVNGPVQGLYRMHDTNMHNTMHGGMMTDLEARWRAFDAFATEQAATERGRRQRARIEQTFRRDAVRLAEQMCDGPDSDPGEIDQVLAFAAGLGPTTRQRLRLGVARRRVALIRGGQRWAARNVPGRVKRDLDSRLRWQLWHRYGV